MKMLMFLFYLCFYLGGVCQSKSGLFNYDHSGNITFKKAFPIQKNLSYTAKNKMAIYANDYNGKIIQESNKLKDYIIYEDSTIISCIIKFQTTQIFQDVLWQGIIEFQKKGDSIEVILDKIKMAKGGNIFTGETVADQKNNLELLDNKNYKPALRKLKDRIDYFFTLFKMQPITQP